MDPALPSAERLLLDLAAGFGHSGRVALVDTDPALLPAAVERLEPTAVSVHHDRKSEEDASRALAASSASGGPEVLVTDDPGRALAGARLVLFRLPPALAALEEFAARAAAVGGPDVVLLGVGSTPHLNRGMNAVLERSFGEVRGSRGRGRFRVLVATGPRPGAGLDRFPRRADLPELGLTVCAHGGAFAGSRLDPGTRLLLGTADRWPSPEALRATGPGRTAVDLGCGTGLIAVTLARRGYRPVLAIDDSAAACASARATAAANGVGDAVAVRREDGLTGRPDGSTGLIVANPPFHRGTVKDSTPAFAMITGAGRVLAGGGELWLVYNSHLPYLPALRRLGPTDVVTRDRSYLVTRTVRG